METKSITRDQAARSAAFVLKHVYLRQGIDLGGKGFKKFAAEFSAQHKFLDEAVESVLIRRIIVPILGCYGVSLTVGNHPYTNYYQEPEVLIELVKRQSIPADNVLDLMRTMVDNDRPRWEAMESAEFLDQLCRFFKEYIHCSDDSSA